MTTVQSQAVDVGVLISCSVVLAYIFDAPRVLKAMVWACALAALGTLALCLTSCSSVPVPDPRVQVAEWPLGQSKPDPAHCSGFAVQTPAGVRVLSAAHCMRDYRKGERLPIVTRDRWQHTAWGVRWCVVEHIDRAADVAVLVPERDALRELAPYELAGRDPEVGEPVTLVSGRVWAQSTGEVGGLYYSDAGDAAVERWCASATIAPGWSGSAVLDRHGRVLGVVTACQAVRADDGSVSCRPGLAVFEAVGVTLLRSGAQHPDGVYTPHPIK